MSCTLNSTENGEYAATWNSFIQSLDVGPDKAQSIEQLPDNQKLQLLRSYTATTSISPAFHYVTLIKSLHTGRFLISKSRKGTLQTAKGVLSATEISLRTHNVSWVYDFLDKGGLGALQDYMSKTICILLSDSSILPASVCCRKNCLHKKFPDSPFQSISSSPFVNEETDISHRFLCIGSKKSQEKSRIRRPTADFKEMAFDSIHQGIKCYRALLNNQRGCTMTFEHPDSITIIALCLFHPKFQTKTLVLELLAAVCLIVGGHDRVVKALDKVRFQLGESRRFESLVHFFISHKSTTSEEEYNLDFMVASMQFFNILVHSTEDITMRVFLQQELTNLGLDEFLIKIFSSAGDRLGRQIEAFLDNHVDVSVLLADSQAKEMYQQEAETLDAELIASQSLLASTQAEYAARCHALEANNMELQTKLSDSNAQLVLNKSQVQTLNSKLTDTHSTASSREKQLEARINELQLTLNKEKEKTSNLVSLQKPASESLNGIQSPIPIPVPTPPPPPPPPSFHTSGSAPPPAPPPPGMCEAPAGSQSVPIRQPYQTKYKLPLINWAVLRNQQLRNTVFVGMNDEKIIKSLNMDRFEEMFRLSGQPIGGQVANGNSGDNADNFDDSTIKKANLKPKKTRIMDANRHRCISILLRYLESEKFTLDKLWQDITNLDVSLDVADRLLHQLPTQNETKMYLNYEYTDNLPVEELTDEDRLFLHICKVSRLSTKLEIVIFINTFDATLENLTPKLSAVNAASLHLKKSVKFSRLLELILAFGNYMNSCRRGMVYGFRLQTLEILIDMKTSDKEITLLHFIVDTIEREFPELLTFYEELDGVTMAAKVPMEALTSDMAAISASMHQADQELVETGYKAPERLVSFVQNNQSKVVSLQQKADTALSIFKQTTEWFGEALNKPSPEQFFGPIVRFIQHFKKAQADNGKRRRAEIAKQINICDVNSRSQSNSTRVAPNAIGGLKKPKDDMNPIEAQKQLAIEARQAKRKFQNRTRHINADGMMDEILAGLTSEPLQVEIHPRRSRGADEL